MGAFTTFYLYGTCPHCGRDVQIEVQEKASGAMTVVDIGHREEKAPPGA